MCLGDAHHEPGLVRRKRCHEISCASMRSSLDTIASCIYPLRCRLSKPSNFKICSCDQCNLASPTTARVVGLEEHDTGCTSPLPSGRRMNTAHEAPFSRTKDPDWCLTSHAQRWSRRGLTRGLRHMPVRPLDLRMFERPVNHSSRVISSTMLLLVKSSIPSSRSTLPFRQVTHWPLPIEVSANNRPSRP